MVKLMGGCIRIGKDGRKGIQLFPLVSSFMSVRVSLNYLIIFLTASGRICILLTLHCLICTYSNNVNSPVPLLCIDGPGTVLDAEDIAVRKHTNT